MKIILHAHTTYSYDGTLSSKQLAEVASSKGFKAVLISDHFESLDQKKFMQLVQDCKKETRCTLIPGYERKWQGYEVCVYGIYEWINDKDIVAWAKKVQSKGGIICLSHPGRYSNNIPNEILDVCDAVEVWNSKWPYDGIVGPDPGAFKLLGASRYALAGQDVHKKRDVSSLAVVIKSFTSPLEVLETIKNKEFVISSAFFTLNKRPSKNLLRILKFFHIIRTSFYSSAYFFYKRFKRFCI